MPGIGNNSPFTPRTPETNSQGPMKLPSAQNEKAETTPKQTDSLGKSADIDPKMGEKNVDEEIVAEVTTLSSDEIVEEELQEAETPAEEEDTQETKEGSIRGLQDKAAMGARRHLVNIGKMTMNEEGRQTDIPDDSIGHLANALLDGNPETLCEAAEILSNIISEDEEDEEEAEKEQENDNDENEE